MRNRALIAVPLALALGVASCDPGPAEPDNVLGPRAETYLIAALDIMETFSVRKYEVDWEALRAQAYEDVGFAKESVDTYPAIVAALERIGDNHSFFLAPDGTQFGPPVQAPGSFSQIPDGPSDAEPSSTIVAPGVAYVDVTPFLGGGFAGDSVAQLYHRLIEDVDTLGATCRWVVDLRGNTGGNMWPMIAGIGPVLGGDTIGFFIDPDSLTSVWQYGVGAAALNGFPLAIADTAYTLDSPDPHVAVLTDGETASSGEAVAIAFKGRMSTRSFGEETWGVSTANSAFPMPDGAVIFLTTFTMVDRDGTVYGEEVLPDEEILGGQKTGDPATDAVLDAALQWLQAQVCS